MSKKSKLRFYCFSPPVMIATFFIEMGLAIYILLFRKMNVKVRLGVLLLFSLAIFQLAEYGICENLGLTNNFWAKIGFTAITFLPPLGLHLVYNIANRPRSKLVLTSYAIALVWVALFWFGNVMSGAVCEGNYVIFHFKEPFEGLYYMYYNSLMLGAIGLAAVFARTATIKLKKALYWLVAGYASFIVPSIFFANFDDYVGTDSPMPSVLCGFAVIFAIIVSTKVIPKVSERK